MDEHDSRVILTSGGTKKNLFTVFMIFFIYLKLEFLQIEILTTEMLSYCNWQDMYLSCLGV